MAETLYHLSTGDEQKGPFTIYQLRAMWQSGNITADAFVWYEGESQWTPITGIAPLLNPVAPTAVAASVPNSISPPALPAASRVGPAKVGSDTLEVLRVQSQMKSKPVAALLAIFIPHLGALYSAPLAAFCTGLISVACIAAAIKTEQAIKPVIFLLPASVAYIASVFSAISGVERFNNRLLGSAADSSGAYSSQEKDSDPVSWLIWGFLVVGAIWVQFNPIKERGARETKAQETTNLQVALEAYADALEATATSADLITTEWNRFLESDKYKTLKQKDSARAEALYREKGRELYSRLINVVSHGTYQLTTNSRIAGVIEEARRAVENAPEDTNVLLRDATERVSAAGAVIAEACTHDSRSDDLKMRRIRETPSRMRMLAADLRDLMRLLNER